MADPGQRVLAGTRPGGRGASLDCWRGLRVESSMVWVEGASGVVGAGRPSSRISMASALSEEAADISSSEVGGASGSGEGIGLALLSL